MTKWASGKILEHPSIKKYIAERKTESMADANATEVVPQKTLSNAADTQESKDYAEEKEDQDEQIINAFQVLNDVTSPGELDFTNPSYILENMNKFEDWIEK